MKTEFYRIDFHENEDKSPRKKFLTDVYDFASTVALSIVGVAIILTFVFRVAVVDGSSMVPTLHDKDRLIISNVNTNYKYKDIVVIHRNEDVPLIKRVIAVAGDTIDIDFDSGIVTVNGEELSEEYILEPTYRYFEDGPEFPLTVPEGFVFVMGDNRNNSLDSRSGQVGLISTQHIAGKMIIDFNERSAK